MASTIFHGKTASAWFQSGGPGGQVAITGVRSWSCTLNVSVADASAMAATTGRTRVVGIKSGTITIEAVYDGTKYVQLDESDNAAFVDDTTGIEIQLLRDATNASLGYKGAAMCTGVSVGVAIDGTPIITYNFTWIGTVGATPDWGT